MYSTRRLPGRTPAPVMEPTDIPEEEQINRVEIEGRLVGVEGSSIMEILHLDLSGTDQFRAQRDLVSMVNRRVRITVEVEASDV